MRTLSSEEKRQHGSKLVPYSYYKCRIPLYFTSVPLHWHSEFEINYILEGKGEFIYGDERLIAEAGDIVIFQPNKLHAVHPYEDVELHYDTLVFRAEMLGVDSDRCGVECILPIVNGMYRVKPQITTAVEDYEEWKRCIESIFWCVTKNSSQDDLLLKSELLRMFWLLEKKGYVCHDERAKSSRSETMRPVLAYINENFRESISIDQLARIANLSKSYFMGCFKQAAGVGAMEYIIQLRVENACKLLVSTCKTSAEIAFECGFSNLSNFNRHFKNLVGCTPNEYRKSVK